MIPLAIAGPLVLAAGLLICTGLDDLRDAGATRQAGLALLGAMLCLAGAALAVVAVAARL